MSSGSEAVVDLTHGEDFPHDHYNMMEDDDDDDLPELGVPRPSWRTDNSQSSVASTATTGSTSSSSTGRKRVKDPELVAQQNAEKERKRQLKEAEKARKLAEKENKARERDEKKRQKEAEKNEKNSARVVARSKKPGECIKYITVIMEQSLLQTGIGAKLLPQLHDMEIQYRFEDFALDKIVCWQREAPADSQNSAEDPPEESQILVILPVEDFVQYVHASVKNTDDINLSLFVSQLEDNLPGKDLTIAVQGIEKYFRDLKTLGQRQYRQNVQNAAGVNEGPKKGSRKINVGTTITRLDLEQALVSMELETKVNFKFPETDEETARLIIMITKAVAETPFKRSRHEVDFSFLPDNKNVVKVGKDGEGLLKLWTNQFLQFNNVSPDVAKAIVAEFPSPVLLIEAYSNAPSRREAELLLSDIRVRRGAGVLETSRRVGKELSRRIHEFMTCDDPKYLLR